MLKQPVSFHRGEFVKPLTSFVGGYSSGHGSYVSACLSIIFAFLLVSSPQYPCQHTKRECVFIYLLKLNFVAVVRKRTIPTERPPLVGEVSTNLCG
jgi:hypothetical protein